MAHCFRRLRELPDADVSLLMLFYGHVRSSAARAKEAKMASVSLKEGPREAPSGAVLPTTLPLSRLADIGAASNTASAVRQADCVPAAVAPSSFFSTLPSSSSYSNENSNASQAVPPTDARAPLVSALAAELRRMGDAVYGLQLGVLHLNDLCVLGHVLNMRRATDYITDSIADFEAEMDRMAACAPASALLAPMPAGDECSPMPPQLTSPVAAKKKRRPLSKNVMVAELDDYHRAQEPMKRERRSALATEIAVPTMILKKESTPKATRASARLKQQSDASASPISDHVGILSPLPPTRKSQRIEVPQPEARPPAEKRVRKEVPTVGATAAASAGSALLSFASPLSTRGGDRGSLLYQQQQLHAPRTLLSPSSPQSQPVSLLASLGLGGLGAAAPPKRFALSANDFDDDIADAAEYTVGRLSSSSAAADSTRGSFGTGGATVGGLTNADEDEDEEEYEEEEWEEEEEVVSDAEDGGAAAEELHVVSGSAFRVARGGAQPQAPQYDFSTDMGQRDAADFLLKQVALQGTLSTSKGAELLVKKRIPFVPIDPATGFGTAGAESAPQTCIASAERFVNCVFKQFHKQEKVAYDHGVAYIY